ncbi:hypothetical protein L873DRAFT_1678424 [Choiromyces venosus 120613-1]|uniref:Uncharacterized protein n=1 Tax=Choiromyces venosus 120613-1 TaxID=1336337 RepID=A0A3N4K506_9PEZI|nr:hypothetical protein L873DRAFT_1678424 [Choiromyces venosus 120613-1]
MTFSIPTLRVRFLYPLFTARPISTTPHLFGFRTKKPSRWSNGEPTKTPKRKSILSVTSFPDREPHHLSRRPLKADTTKAPVTDKLLPRAPSRDFIHYIPPSSPMRQRLGPGMYYDPKAVAYRCSSTPIDKDKETEYLYTLMLRRTFSMPVSPTKIVALKFAINRCMEASGAHNKATTTRLRKGFISEAVASKITKRRAWVCDRARTECFDWDLHENMRYIHGHLFSGHEVDFWTKEGQVLGAQAFVKEDFEEMRGRRFREAMDVLQRDRDVSAAGAAEYHDATEVAAAAADAITTTEPDSQYTDGDKRLRLDWVLQASSSDTDFEVLMTADNGEAVGDGWDEDKDEGGDEGEDRKD